MPRQTDDKYTLVMHSGVLTGHSGFARGVEERSIYKPSDIARVEKAGGLLFDGYKEAADRAELENFPLDTTNTGLYPRVRGHFSKLEIDGLRIYVAPAPAATVPADYDVSPQAEFARAIEASTPVLFDRDSGERIAE